jgi:aarF domain-containing kinase
MSGKRILDAVALLKASRNIAAKHVDIRLSQADIYTKTSSLFKAVQSQAPAPFAVAAQSFSQSVSSAAKQTDAKEPIPHEGAEPGSIASDAREGVKQDHFYKPSVRNSSLDPGPEQELEIDQQPAARRPLPDGTIPPTESPIGAETGDAQTFYKRPTAEDGQHPIEGDDGHLNIKPASESTIPDPSLPKPMSSKAARQAQRQSEDQIPAHTADPPVPEDDVPPGFSVEQEQDVFYQPPDSSSPVLSALPRMRVPKIENDVQAGNTHIPEGLNADVYYSGDQDVEKHGDEPTEEQLSQIFANPRIARMLGTKAKYVPPGVQRKPFHTATRVFQKTSEAEKEDLKRLAADMAKDVQNTKVSHLSRNVQVIQADQTDSKRRPVPMKCASLPCHLRVSAESSNLVVSQRPWRLEQ